MTFFALIGWAFSLGCAVAVFIVPIAAVLWLFENDVKKKDEGWDDRQH